MTGLRHALAVVHDDLGYAGHVVLGVVLGPDRRARCVVVSGRPAARLEGAEQIVSYTTMAWTVRHNLPHMPSLCSFV